MDEIERNRLLVKTLHGAEVTRFTGVTSFDDVVYLSQGSGFQAEVRIKQIKFWRYFGHTGKPPARLY
jgi:hypothetical protein